MYTKDYMIPKSLRFHGHGTMRHVYKNADTYHSRLFTVKVSKHPFRKSSRLAVVVSKKVHKSAVGRNRIRRRVYELLRHHVADFIEPRDVVVIVVSGETLHVAHEELASSLESLLKKAGLLKDSE